ncbi:hypothetical protein P692DRAFT_20358812 [Suillus brevipes Sb2]|nr:hypothetical protein P692DRAFT_20358812 [Suillus brevipes Sb2]
MLYDVQFSHVRLLIGYPMVFSMESHHRIPLHEAIPVPQHCQAARFSAACLAIAPPMFMRRHRPLLSIGLEPFSNRGDKVVIKLNCKGVALQLVTFRMQRENVEMPQQGRDGKDRCPGKTLLQAARGLPSRMQRNNLAQQLSPSHLCNPSQLSPIRLPQLLSVIMLRLQVRRPHGLM